MLFLDEVAKFTIKYPTVSLSIYYILLLIHIFLPIILISILLLTKNILIIMVIILFEVCLLLHWLMYRGCILDDIERELAPNNITALDIGQIFLSKSMQEMVLFMFQPFIVLLALYKLYYVKCKRC